MGKGRGFAGEGSKGRGGVGKATERGVEDDGEGLKVERLQGPLQCS